MKNYCFIKLILMIFLLAFPFSSFCFIFFLFSVKGIQTFSHKANICKYIFQFQKLNFCIFRYGEELTINPFYMDWFYFWVNTDV